MYCAAVVYCSRSIAEKAHRRKSPLQRFHCSDSIAVSSFQYVSHSTLSIRTGTFSQSIWVASCGDLPTMKHAMPTPTHSMPLCSHSPSHTPHHTQPHARPVYRLTPPPAAPRVAGYSLPSPVPPRILTTPPPCCQIHSPRLRTNAASSLGLTELNSEMFYDMYRCARCPHPLVPGKLSDVTSSFFHAVDMLHARMHNVPNLEGVLSL